MLTISDKELKYFFANISTNYRKNVHAYLSKTNQDYDKLEDYLLEYSEEEFNQLIKGVYHIEGEVTFSKILKAKKNEGYVPSEYEEQKALVKWLKNNKIKHQASGNGYKLDMSDYRYIAKIKAMGLCKGYPDLIVYLGNGKTLHIEMKRTKGGKVSDEQENWLKWLNDNNYPSKVCYGAKEAIEFVKDYIESEA